MTVPCTPLRTVAPARHRRQPPPVPCRLAASVVTLSGYLGRTASMLGLLTVLGAVTALGADNAGQHAGTPATAADVTAHRAR